MIKQIDLTNKKVIISRTDSIGDVMLVLPICTWLKANFQGIYIYFLGNAYTKAVVNSYDSVDEFIDWKELESKSKEEQISFLKA
ncbi:MAG: hypothetical protein LW701_02700 [Fluviicola sp.]|nr:hypothetical protein [Fluviicola sp.]